MKKDHNTNDRPPMKNITINIPEIYDKNIQELIKMKLVDSRSEAIRIALRNFLQKEKENVDLLELLPSKEE